ncbi:MAG: hypothetical protein ACRDQA_08890 [Nocardioidaceae bacterium]
MSGTVLTPVVQVVDEVETRVVTPVSNAVVAPVAKTVEPVLAPVAKTVEPVLAPVTKTVHPLLAPVGKTLATATKTLQPLLASVDQTLAPVTKTVGPVLAPVTKTVEPVLAPVTKTVGPVLEPVRQVTDPVLSSVGVTRLLGPSGHLVGVTSVVTQLTDSTDSTEGVEGADPAQPAAVTSTVALHWTPADNTQAPDTTTPGWTDLWAGSTAVLAPRSDVAETRLPTGLGSYSLQPTTGSADSVDGTQRRAVGEPMSAYELAPLGATADPLSPTGPQVPTPDHGNLPSIPVPSSGSTGSPAPSGATGGVSAADISDLRLPGTTACGAATSSTWRLPGSPSFDPGCSPD